MVEEAYAAFLQDNLSAVIVAAAVFGALAAPVANRRKGKCRAGETLLSGSRRKGEA
jgi:hypothetical protein